MVLDAVGLLGRRQTPHWRLPWSTCGQNKSCWFVGDGALAVFEPARVDAAIEMLLQLKQEVDDFFAERGWECRANMKAYYGSVVAGEFGARSEKRFDVLGKTVNTAAILVGSGGVTLSTEAFRKLGPELRRRFKKHTAPVTYVRTEDPHRLRWDR